jgi:hypothetical protein
MHLSLAPHGCGRYVGSWNDFVELAHFCFPPREPALPVRVTHHLGDRKKGEHGGNMVSPVLSRLSDEFG